ncbi:hypothetical protein PJN36_12435 [Mycobacterium kansasii]|uniref:hypothetical protein n=1 Tax=Mycobacterium persicum TaxID=1487726 RepID=UPI0020CFEFB0|nr:hypothetical protein [Mycobacterium persicum]
MKVVETVRGWLAALVVAGAFVDCEALSLVLPQAAAMRTTTERPATTRITAAREANNMGTAPFGFGWGLLFGKRHSAAVTTSFGPPSIDRPDHSTTG